MVVATWSCRYYNQSSCQAAWSLTRCFSPVIVPPKPYQAHFFSFAAYLGAISATPPNGILGALIALIAIFLPSYLLVVSGLAFWATWRRYPFMPRAMQGINAAVVGLLVAALYHPVWTSAIFSVADVMLALAAFALLQFGKCPPWAVVLLGAAVG